MSQGIVDSLLVMRPTVAVNGDRFVATFRGALLPGAFASVVMTTMVTRTL